MVEESSTEMGDMIVEDFMSNWMTSVGEDIARPQTIAVLDLCRAIGIHAIEDLELIAPSLLEIIPPGTPPVVAFRLHQHLHTADRMGAGFGMVSKLSFAEFSTQLRLISAPPSTPAPPLATQAVTEKPQRPPSSRQKSFPTRPRSSEFFNPTDFHPALVTAASPAGLPDTTQSWGSLPPLYGQRKNDYRDAFDTVDPYGASLNEEATRIVAKLREKILTTAVATVLPFSGRRTNFMRWRNSFVLRRVDDDSWPSSGSR